MKLNILRVEKREDCFVFVDDILLFPRLSSMASPFALFHSNITLALSRLFSLSDNYFTFSYFYEASTSSAAPSCLGVIPNSNGAGCLHVGQPRTTAKYSSDPRDQCILVHSLYRNLVPAHVHLFTYTKRCQHTHNQDPQRRINQMTSGTHSKRQWLAHPQWEKLHTHRRP